METKRDSENHVAFFRRLEQEVRATAIHQAIDWKDGEVFATASTMVIHSMATSTSSKHREGCREGSPFGERVLEGWQRNERGNIHPEMT